MPTLPKKIIHVLRQFETVFSERMWEWAKVLLIGAILAPGERTVTAILRVMGCANEKQFQKYHRVLNRATWSSRELSRRLLVLLVHLFVSALGPVIIGIDETIERDEAARSPHEASIVIRFVRARSSLSKPMDCVGSP